jgi:iron complex transport system substrate-binding protein
VFLDSFEDPIGAATSFITPLSLPFLLEGLVPMLEAAVDGDPATEVPASAPN